MQNGSVYPDRKKGHRWHRDNSGQRNPMFHKHHSPETKEKMRQSKLALYAYLEGEWWTRGSRPSISKEKNPNYRGGHSVTCDNCGAEIGWRRPYRIKGQKHHFCNANCMGEWQSKSSEFLALVMKANQIKPNRKELALLDIIKQLSLPYSYVGDGQFILGGKCPDFLNTNGQKKLIELWGNFWHQGQNPQDRIDYFAKYGFETLIIWESELNKPTELEERLLNFDAKRLGML